jgi:hypothetical protein
LFGIVLFRARVPCSWREAIMASIASMGLSHAIARGIWRGLFRKQGVFVRTAKRRRLTKKGPGAFTPVREELLMAIALALAIVGMAIAYGGRYLEGQLWMLILAAQAIPYVSALIGAWVAKHSREEPEAEQVQAGAFAGAGSQ